MTNDSRELEQEAVSHRLWSRRKLLASLGMLGAYVAASGAGSAQAVTVADAVYTPENPPPHPHKGQNESWIDITRPPYNARPGGEFDNSAIFQAAIDDAANDGAKIYVPAGDYLLASGFAINKDHVTIEGTGRLILGRHIELLGNGFYCSGLRFKALNTTSSIRGLFAATAQLERVIERITVENCEFEHFFYATHFRGTDQFPVKDIVVTNCKSVAPVGTNAGHFQNVCTMNTYYSGNSCYNGQNATSYNFFGGNGKIKIIGNYDFNNLYGSCEIENSPGAEVLIASNNFEKQLWIDDSSNVVIDGNMIKQRIFITVQDNDCENVIISNNITDRIYVDKFGTYRNGNIKNLGIWNNELTGPGSWGIFIRGTQATSCRIADNRIASGFTSGSIGIVRGSALDLDICGNDVNGAIIFSGSGGTVRVYDNKHYTLSGHNDASSLERLFQSSGNALNVTDVKFVQSQSMVAAAGAAGSVAFALNPLAADSGKVTKLTFTVCVKGVTQLFDAAEQSVIVSNSAGETRTSAGTLNRVSMGPETLFLTAYHWNAEKSELVVSVSNQSAGSMSVSISLMEYAAVKAPT
ncbi:glycoside hydrolase family 55 protein [Paenibacillus allorhizosphaerae]|uniref:Rhamnogalacturonase A/B/Epimerase-like pectate lyase domain-containing protein n=1 Tax=Paenibacillus allorhizosphaerae TaxID=2849866 RepID=A0ABM8VAU0_9BACL|nr:glycoside hydrolase family 55 protein [Paenibacillus allorhizosphaerae]CAG7617418.1 hypothetical protein PAECIP111802_00406 [Paenibacillus allorhizosphaerae]